MKHVSKQTLDIQYVKHVQTRMTSNIWTYFETKNNYPVCATVSNMLQTISKQFRTYVKPIPNTFLHLFSNLYQHTSKLCQPHLTIFPTASLKMPSVRALGWDNLISNLFGITEIAFMWNTAFSNCKKHEMKRMERTCWGPHSHTGSLSSRLFYLSGAFLFTCFPSKLCSRTATTTYRKGVHRFWMRIE